MSALEQNELDALLASANDLVTETAEAVGGPKPPARSRPPVQVDPKDLKRILNMRFPMIVVLAERKMCMKDVLNWTVGSIVEFDRASDAELDLAVANRRIGSGQAVKVGEYFGLRLGSTEPIQARIRALSG